MKTENSTLKAPALEGGLSIMDMLAAAPEGLSFTDIEQALPQSRATVTRLLKIMINRGYIIQHAWRGRYFPGPGMLNNALADVRPQLWAKHSEETLKQLMEATRNSSILLYWNGFGYQSLAKQLHPESIVMQEIGKIDTALIGSPWGWIAISEFYQPVKYAQLNRKAQAGMELKPEMLEFYQQNNFAFDDGFVFPGIRRLGFPIFAGKVLVGAIGLGGTAQSIPDGRLPEFCEIMKKASNELSLQWNAINRF